MQVDNNIHTEKGGSIGVLNDAHYEGGSLED